MIPPILQVSCRIRMIKIDGCFWRIKLTKYYAVQKREPLCLINPQYYYIALVEQYNVSW